MRFTVFLYFVLSVLSISIEAYQIKSKFKFTDSTIKTWTEGEIRTVDILIWPIEEIDTGFLKKELLGKRFLDFFFVSKIHKAGFSQNNPEAYELKMDLTLVKHFNKQKPIIWSYKGLNIPIRIEDIRILSDKNKIKEFVVFKTPEKANETTNNLAYAILIIALIIGYLAHRYFGSKKVAIKTDRDWKEVLANATTREDFEMLYEQRTVWMDSLGGENPQFIELIYIINKHQYKKTWGDEELSSIDFIFSEIKDSLNYAE